MNVVIVGVGPAGSLMAILLAKHGHNVKVYETYGETRDCKSRSINITLSDRGVEALKRAIPRIDKTVLLGGAKAYGRIVHDKRGKQSKPTLYGQNNEAIISFKRNQLVDFLLSELKKYAKIEVNFFHELVDVEFGTAKLTFRNTQTKQLIDVDADLVIGADGAHSFVRYSMQKTNCLKFIAQQRHDHCYIEFHIPKNDTLDNNMLHMWPRHNFMMLALPNKDGSFCGNLFMVKEEMQRVMQNRDTLIEFCRENFTDVLDIVGTEELVQDFKPCENFTPYCLTSTKCEPYHACGKVVLIGDAAHTVVPFYGQGMNAAFQDCQLLEEILDEFGHNKDYISAALQKFSEVQCKNGHAIADIAFEHYTQLRSGIAGNMFYIVHFINRLLNGAFPNRWPLEYDMVAFSRLPYHDCLVEKRRQQKVLEKIFYSFIIAILLFAFCAFFYVMSIKLLSCEEHCFNLQM